MVLQSAKVSFTEFSEGLRQLPCDLSSSQSVRVRGMDVIKLNAVVRTDRTQRSFAPTKAIKLLIEYKRVNYQHRVPNTIKQRTDPVSPRLAVQNRQVEAHIERNDRNPFLHPIGKCRDDLVNRLGRNPAFDSRSLRGNPVHSGSPTGDIDTRIDQPVVVLDKPTAISEINGCSNDAIKFSINTGCLDVKRGKALPVPVHAAKLKARPDETSWTAPVSGDTVTEVCRAEPAAPAKAVHGFVKDRFGASRATAAATSLRPEARGKPGELG